MSLVVEPVALPAVTRGLTHHGSHTKLINYVDADAVHPGVIDAIIVPTARPSRHLTAALDLAAQLDCQLLALASKDSSAQELAALAARQGARAVAVDTAGLDGILLPVQATAALLADWAFSGDSDLSAKRNLGLLISRMRGWRRVLFLDDDIRKLSQTDVAAAAGLLSDYDAVGLGNEGLPDNSVVCHAYREVGGRQETFVSGGILAIAPDRIDAFFPDVYSEDWFCLYDVDRIAITGSTAQDDYDPFASPRRAQVEELGDCLAEGLYWLRDVGKGVADADPAFWERFLQTRRELIDQVLDRLRLAPSQLEPQRTARMIASLEAARAASELVTSDLCTRYISAWQADRSEWRDMLKALPPLGSVEDCLRWLEKSQSPESSLDWTTRVWHSIDG